MSEKLISFFRGMQRPRMGRRLAALAAGVFAMGLGVAVFERIGFGTDCCSTMTLGVSRVTGIPFGTTQLMANLLLMGIVLWKDVSRIGIGTAANMICIGYIAQFFMGVFDGIPAMNQLTLVQRLIIFVPTILLFLVGASVYMVVDLGVAPYDAVPQIIAAHTKRLSFRTIRVIWDVGILLIGFALGSTVGLVTLILGFFLGPMISAVAARVMPFFE